MRIYLHIGMEHCGGARLQDGLEQKRAQLAARGVLFAKSPGRKNHTRLFMAMTDPDHIDPLRHNRGFGGPGDQARLHRRVAEDLAREIDQASPKSVILSATQLSASLMRESELARLRALLGKFSDDIRIIAHIDEPARLLVRAYGEQITCGRTRSLAQELGLAGSADWRGDCLRMWPENAPEIAGFGEVQAPPFWLDFSALQAAWEGVFGPGSLRFRPYDAARFASGALIDEIREAFDIKENIGKIGASKIPMEPSAATLARGRLLNVDLVRLLKAGHVIPRQLWKQFIREIALPGAPIDPASLAAVSKTFERANTALLRAHPALSADGLKRPRARKPWEEADPEFGFRATQYITAFLPRINRASREARESAPDSVPDSAPGTDAPKPNGLSPSAQALMGPQALETYAQIKGGAFAPHNRLGRPDEQAAGPAFDEITPRQLPAGSSGNVIVGCMKNEAPYILEWIAYHRQIGIDHFIIYTNGCEDGTSEILDRLQQMGVLEHRNNDAWRGNSPQQHALNMSLKEKVIRNAEWVIHIDVDEFINIRCGNGTLVDFLARVPEATNVAMTWRMFGSNGVARLADRPVIGQFDACAPKFCPKPHTVWGFKTMFRNIGAYEKISCHRPNKLRTGFDDKVKWVNGNGRPMGEAVKEKGWRSTKASIGYDLLQLNHYALRSAESFLIKRQRGRALHVDRSIGINYWVRMDWNDNRDVSIQRNLARLEAELARLKSDAALARWHRHGLDWHRAKAADLHATAEFDDLYQQTLKVRLTELERVAYALALDMES